MGIPAEDVIRRVLTCFVCSGHVLLEDVPGTGKTMLLRAFAKTVGGDFKRIQFTPDLLPSDLTGINFYNQLSAMGGETVQPPLTYDTEKGCYHTTDLALFRMDQGGVVSRETCPHQVVLLDADGTELVRYNLYDYLQRFAKEIDVTKQEATIPLEIQFSQLGVEIVLPGWNIEDVTPDGG